MRKEAHGRTVDLVAIDTSTTFLAAGAGGWIDTDLSAVLPAEAIGVFGFFVGAGAGSFGTRAHGEATAPLITVNVGTIASGISAARHVDFHQDAAQAVNYYVTHYLRLR